MEKYTVSIKSCCNLKKCLFVLLPLQTAESVNCSFSLKNLEKYFCNLTSKKTSSNTSKIYPNIYRKNLSIIDIALRNWDYRLAYNRYRPGIFWNYRLSLSLTVNTENFIVPITASASEILVFEQWVIATVHQNSFWKSCFRIWKNLYHQYSW